MNPTLKKILVAAAYMAGGALAIKLGEWAVRRIRGSKPTERNVSASAAK